MFSAHAIAAAMQYSFAMYHLLWHDYLVILLVTCAMAHKLQSVRTRTVYVRFKWN